MKLVSVLTLRNAVHKKGAKNFQALSPTATIPDDNNNSEFGAVSQATLQGGEELLLEPSTTKASNLCQVFANSYLIKLLEVITPCENPNDESVEHHLEKICPGFSSLSERLEVAYKEDMRCSGKSLEKII